MAVISQPIAKHLLSLKRQLREKAEADGLVWDGSKFEALYKLSRKMAAAHIPQKFWGHTLAALVPQNPISERTMKKISGYVANLERAHMHGIGLFFFGPHGTGKSFAASLVGKECLRSNYSARFTMLSEIITMFTDGWYDVGKRADFIEIIREVDFLIIDDVAREYQSKNADLNRAALDAVFRGRANDNLPTIVTSNYDFLAPEGGSGLNEAYGDHLISLFKEHLIKCPLVGFDIRDTKIAPSLEATLLGEA